MPRPIRAAARGLIAEIPAASVALKLKNGCRANGPALARRHAVRSTQACRIVSAFAAVLMSATSALAQKQGGTLKYYHRDNPPTTSIHEEATVSTVNPFMAVFNNLVLFDQTIPRNALDTIVPDLAESWTWSDDKKHITFKLRQGVKWHDGNPFSAKDVVCTFDLLLGKAKDGLRLNPRQVWYHNVLDVAAEGDFAVAIQLKEPQPSFLALLASGYTPIYPCHVSPRDMRNKPIGTGPFKFVEFRRNEVIRLARNPDYWKPGRPYLDGIELRIIPSRSTRILAFVSGEFDMTWDTDVSIPLMKDVEAQAPKAICELRPTGVYTNLLVNREAAPFNDPKLRLAMALSMDRKAFDDILGQGKLGISGAMQPLPEGAWGMSEEILRSLPGYGADVEGNRAQARAIMTSLGYGADKPLKLKVSTRDIAIYRDPAVILMDHLKQIYVDPELDVVDTTIWHRKIVRGEYSVGLNLTGLAVDDPDVNFVENYSCGSERNYSRYCNPEVDALIAAQSKEFDIAKRKAIVWQIERKLAEDVARPVIHFQRAATCWYPHVKGLVLHQNSIYNGARFEDVWLDK
jgi:peptide/nickel transport system substrate-binding protein